MNCTANRNDNPSGLVALYGSDQSGARKGHTVAAVDVNHHLGRRLRIQYGTDLACAHLLATLELMLVVASFRGKLVRTVEPLLSEDNAFIVAVLTLAGALVVAVVGAVILVPSPSWLLSLRDPNVLERKTATSIEVFQTAVFLAVWLGSGFVMMLCNLSASIAGFAFIGVACLFGAASAASTGLLRSQRTLRPMVCLAELGPPSVGGSVLRQRLLAMWVVCGVVPSAGIVTMILMRARGWVIEQSASIEAPITMFLIVALATGLRAVIVLARSIALPVREVVQAMAQVQRGNIDIAVDAYERGELGELQTGFNGMVSGLKDRDRLRDLFARHVGESVVHRAVEQQSLNELCDMAVLFIDLVGSTQLAASRSPQEVAGILNDFFRIVVAAVDQYSGLVNKFQGDAALVIYETANGAIGASQAMATARMLGVELRRLPLIDYGIGVSAGVVFAGNIGSEHRYEYTVIGDAVNEAARLADRAKSCQQRTLCSDSAYCRANPAERTHWTRYGILRLRGRSATTRAMVPNLEENAQCDIGSEPWSVRSDADGAVGREEQGS
jgi:adenylate cyclase